MSLVIKSNGHGPDRTIRPPEKQAGRAQTVSSSAHMPENEVAFQTADGVEVRARLLRLTRHAVAFEASQLTATLRTSEVLSNFKITGDQRVLYFGRAVVSNVMNTGESLMAEAKLDSLGPETAFFLPPGSGSSLPAAYDTFLRNWQKHYRISAEFKVLVADVQSYLTGVRHWLEGWEFSLNPQADKAAQEREILAAVAPRIIAAFNGQHERFEEIIYALPPEMRGAHQDFVRDPAA